MTAEEILIRRIPKPHDETREELLAWFVESLGLEHGRDIHQTLRRILHMLLTLSQESRLLSTERLEEELLMPGSRINHHIRLLIKAGMLERDKRSIRLRGRTIEETVEEIRRDSERIFDDIIRMARLLDEAYGLRQKREG